MLVYASSTQDIHFPEHVTLKQRKLGLKGAACYTLAFHFDVCKVEFAWSLWTPNAKPRHTGRGCKSTGVERGDRYDPSGTVLVPGYSQEKTDEAED